jgi:hypothetical protein
LDCTILILARLGCFLMRTLNDQLNTVNAKG